MQLRTLNRNKRRIYLAKRDTTKPQPPQFFEVVGVDINFEVASGQSDIEAFGENYPNIRKSNLDNDLKDINGDAVSFNENDRVYLEQPVSYDRLANDADYKVSNVLPSINNTFVIYERLSGKNG